MRVMSDAPSIDIPTDVLFRQQIHAEVRGVSVGNTMQIRYGPVRRGLLCALESDDRRAWWWPCVACLSQGQ